MRLMILTSSLAGGSANRVSLNSLDSLVPLVVSPSSSTVKAICFRVEIAPALIETFPSASCSKLTSFSPFVCSVSVMKSPTMLRLSLSRLLSLIFTDCMMSRSTTSLKPKSPGLRVTNSPAVVRSVLSAPDGASLTDVTSIA